MQESKSCAYARLKRTRKSSCSCAGIHSSPLPGLLNPGFPECLFGTTVLPNRCARVRAVAWTVVTRQRFFWTKSWSDKNLRGARRSLLVRVCVRSVSLVPSCLMNPKRKENRHGSLQERAAVGGREHPSPLPDDGAPHGYYRYENRQAGQSARPAELQ